MFGNLKNKLGEAADLKKYAAPQNLVNSLMGSRQRSGNQTPSIVPASPSVGRQQATSGSSNKQISGAVTPLPSVSHSPLSPASSRTHSRQTSINSLPLSPGMSPTPPTEDTNGVLFTPPQLQVSPCLLYIDRNSLFCTYIKNIILIINLTNIQLLTGCSERN